MRLKSKKIEKSAAEEQQEQASARAIKKDISADRDSPHWELSRRQDIRLSIWEILAMRR